jgi:hypothetical protein
MPRTLTPHANTPRTPLERLSRLAGRTSFVTPGTRGGRPAVGTTEDLAQAIGWVRDPLAQTLAMAVASGSLAERERIEGLAHPLVLSMLEARAWTHRMVAGARRHRARLVLRAAIVDVVMGRPPKLRWLARSARMRYQDCRVVYRVIACVLEARAQEGAYEACQRLFG